MYPVVKTRVKYSTSEENTSSFWKKQNKIGTNLMQINLDPYIKPIPFISTCQKLG